MGNYLSMEYFVDQRNHQDKTKISLWVQTTASGSGKKHTFKQICGSL